MSALKTQWPLILALSLMFTLILLNAVIFEDAFITFRVIDNLYQGYGLRWNIDERVQAYTHPLWMLLHVPFYALSQNLFLISIGLSFVCSVLAVCLALHSVQRPVMTVLCLFLLPLCLSYSFITYSTSGFENALLHALFAWTCWITLRARSKHFWFYLSLATSLSLMTRLDTVIFYAPFWLYMLITLRKHIHWRQIALGALPLIAWECFSLFYYGFAFPNTKYAKLDTGIGEDQFIRLGLLYLLNTAAVDSVSMLLMVIQVLAIPFLAIRYGKTGQRELGLGFSIAVWSLLYTLYVVYAGGTFLTGRLLSLQVFSAAWLLLLLAKTVPLRMLIEWALMVSILYVIIPPEKVLRQQCRACFSGVGFNSQEGDIYLASYVFEPALPQPRMVDFWSPVPAGSLGKWGYSLKREVHVVDYIGLAEPLLARLPSSITRLTTTGIMTRDVPKGYLEAIKTGDTSKMDPDLAAYYEKLHLIVSGDLWSIERWKEILRFNIGSYDHHRDAYLSRQSKPAAP